MDNLISIICEFLMKIANRDLDSVSVRSHYQTDVRELKQQREDRKKKS